MGIDHFIEIGPHPVLVGMGAECVPTGIKWLPSMRRDRPEWTDLLESLQQLYISGVEVDWEGFDREYCRRRRALPTYPFQRRSYWSSTLGQTPGKWVGADERWLRLTARLDREAARGPLDLNARSYPAKWEILARLTSAQAAAILRSAGLFARSGDQYSLDDVISICGIGATYRHLVKRWLDDLVSRGSLHSTGVAYVANVPLAVPDMDELRCTAESMFEDNRPLFAYFEHCRRIAGDVLTGKESPLETLFPNGSFELAEGLYERSTTMQYVNALTAAAIDDLVLTYPTERTLRILEVGAGTGGTTSALLPVLPTGHVAYLFTDVSDLFLERARQRFCAYPFLRSAQFDIDKDVAPRGHELMRYDVIVSANAIHASVDLRAALRRIHDLLEPGGVLVLVESTTHLAWFDMTTGLIEGWQHFADDLRTDNPLLARDAWIGALRDAGFERADAWPRADTPADELGQHVIVARVSGEVQNVPRGIAVVSDSSVSESVARGATVERASLRERLLAASPIDRRSLLREFVREQVMATLRLDASRPPGRNERLMDLGFDSLMAVQLRNTLTLGLGLERRLSATILFDYPTIEALAGRLHDLVVPESAEPCVTTVTVAQGDRIDAERITQMSEAEVEAELLRRLEGK
jgi:SAM-dependent methyltransferase